MTETMDTSTVPASRAPAGGDLEAGARRRRLQHERRNKIGGIA